MSTPLLGLPLSHTHTHTHTHPHTHTHTHSAVEKCGKSTRAGLGHEEAHGPLPQGAPLGAGGRGAGVILMCS